MNKVTLLLGYLGVGLAVGLLSGLLGIGGGVLLVPAIALIWGQSMQVAVGTSLAVIVPCALAGTLRHHFSFGNVDFRLAGLLAVGSILGAFTLGAPLAEYLPGPVLKKIFGIVMIVIGLRMVGAGQWLATLLS